MTSVEWLHSAHAAEYVGFAAAVVVNTTLLTLIVRKSRKELGNYKYLMMSFASFGIVYSFVDVITQPTIHIYGTTFMVFTDRRTLGISKTLGAENQFPATYCSCYCMTIVLLAIHFIYRYFAVCKPTYLMYFRGGYLFVWPFIVVFFGVDWGVTSYFLEPETQESSEYVKDAIWEHYALRMDEIAYVGPHYFFIEADGTLRYNWPSCIGMFNLAKIMGISNTAVLFCGISTFIKMRRQASHFSQKTKDLQKQLFRALVLQTAIPMAFMYIPVSVLFVSPFFRVELGAPTSFVAVTLALYPALDPLAVIFAIRDYRVCFTDVCKRKRYKTSSEQNNNSFSFTRTAA